MAIGHYPEQNLKTTFDQFLSWPFVKNQTTKLWIDVKTMKGSDVKDSFLEFENFDKLHNLKKRSILESWDDGLQVFSNNGWYIFYYIHPKNWPECENFKVNVSVYAKQILTKIKYTNSKSVSFFQSTIIF